MFNFTIPIEISIVLIPFYIYMGARLQKWIWTGIRTYLNNGSVSHFSEGVLHFFDWKYAVLPETVLCVLLYRSYDGIQVILASVLLGVMLYGSKWARKFIIGIYNILKIGKRKLLTKIFTLESTEAIKMEDAEDATETEEEEVEDAPHPPTPSHPPFSYGEWVSQQYDLLRDLNELEGDGRKSVMSDNLTNITYGIRFNHNSILDVSDNLSDVGDSVKEIDERTKDKSLTFKDAKIIAIILAPLLTTLLKVFNILPFF